MDIEYREIKEFDNDSLSNLLCSIDWPSLKDTERVRINLENSDKVFSAWDGDILVGFISSLCGDDGLTAFFHYIVVKPEYQGRRIGQNLLEMMIKEYDGIHIKAVVFLKGVLGFYRKFGFAVESEEIPAIIPYSK